MLKRALHISLSVALVFLLLLNGISHDFLHRFTGHEDTIDCVHHDHNSDHAAFETAHHHCDFLNLQSPVFLTSSVHFSYYIPLQHNDYYVLLTLRKLNPEIRYTALRGPPALI